MTFFRSKSALKLTAFRVSGRGDDGLRVRSEFCRDKTLFLCCPATCVPCFGTLIALIPVDRVRTEVVQVMEMIVETFLHPYGALERRRWRRRRGRRRFVRFTLERERESTRLMWGSLSSQCERASLLIWDLLKVGGRVQCEPGQRSKNTKLESACVRVSYTRRCLGLYDPTTSHLKA